MATPSSVKNKIQGLINSANATTGKKDKDLTSGVNSLIAGYGQGGGSSECSGEHIITVDELPTENIDERAMYRTEVQTLVDVAIYIEGMPSPLQTLRGTGFTGKFYYVQELPTENVDYLGVYYVVSEGVVYIPDDGTKFTTLPVTCTITNVSQIITTGIYAVVSTAGLHQYSNEFSDIILFDDSTAFSLLAEMPTAKLYQFETAPPNPEESNFEDVWVVYYIEDASTISSDYAKGEGDIFFYGNMGGGANWYSLSAMWSGQISFKGEISNESEATALGYYALCGGWIAYAAAPKGSISITDNAIVDVTEYATAIVNVEQPLQDKTVTTNGRVDPDEGYYGLSSIYVDVPPLYKVTSAQGMINALNAATDDTIGAVYKYVGTTSSGYKENTYYMLMANIKDYFFEEVTPPVLTGELEYKITTSTSGDYASILGVGQYYDTNLVIPSVYNGLPVRSMYEGALKMCERLASVFIPSSLEYLSRSGFAYCPKLSSVTFEKGSSIKSIPESAFRDCDALTSIDIPTGVTEVAKYAFEDCCSLASVTFPQTLTTIGYFSFSNNDSLTSVEIPDSVTVLESGVFHHCDKLTSAKLSKNITVIPDSAFHTCIALTSIVIPSGATEIKWGAFFACESLESVVIPKSVLNIATYAFRGCSKLTDVYYTGTEEEWAAITVGEDNQKLLGATIHYNYAG